MEYFNNFILVDDDKVNNMICTKIIRKLYSEATVTSFLTAREGLNHIVSRYGQPHNTDVAVLLLDIIMPEMDAWDFLKEFESFEPSLKDRIKIYIISSSVDKKDMMKANADKHVEYYLMKPLTSESIHLMVHVLNKKLVKQQ
jgi:response regulator RpfG family c-di-GMP phosphodiesterase